MNSLKKDQNSLLKNRNFISLDETSFSRKGKDVYGFSSKSEKIHIQIPWKRLTTKSCLSFVDRNGNLQYYIHNIYYIL